MENPIDLLYQKGTLEEKTSKSTVDWPNITFYAHAAGEPFQNFTVITLIAHYQELAFERAASLTVTTSDDVDQWIEEVEVKAKEIMDSGELTVREMVQVSDDHNVLVVLDEFEVTDASMDRALGMLEESNVPGTTFFGQNISFTSEYCEGHRRKLEEKQNEDHRRYYAGSS